MGVTWTSRDRAEYQSLSPARCEQSWEIGDERKFQQSPLAYFRCLSFLSLYPGPPSTVLRQFPLGAAHPSPTANAKFALADGVQLVVIGPVGSPNSGPETIDFCIPRVRRQISHPACLKVSHRLFPACLPCFTPYHIISIVISLLPKNVDDRLVNGGPVFSCLLIRSHPPVCPAPLNSR